MQYGAKIIGWGRALPEKVVTNFDLEKLFDTTNDWIVQRTGIKERRVVDPTKPEETAVSLGCISALKAIESAKKYQGIDVKPEDIDLIICSTATGDFLFPSTACLIQSKLGATKAAAFDISAACTGFIYGLNTAYNFIQSGQCKNVLVIAVDLMSKFVDWEDRKTAIIFGDGSGAALITSTSLEKNCMHPFYIRSAGDEQCSLFLKNQGSHYPVAQKDITETREMVFMDGPAVYEFAVKAVPDALDKACELSGIKPEQIDYLVPHQANVRIINSAARRLGLASDKVIVNIDRYGNTSAASIPIALDEALEQGRIKYREDGNTLKIALVGFGAGLTWGATIIEI